MQLCSFLCFIVLVFHFICLYAILLLFSVIVLTVFRIVYLQWVKKIYIVFLFNIKLDANREGVRVRSYIPGNATNQTRFGAKSDHALSRLCYGLRRYIPGVAPVALRCVLVRPDKPRLCPGHWWQSLGVSRFLYLSYGSSTANPRCYMVACKWKWNSVNLLQSCHFRRTELNYYTKAKRTTEIRLGEEIGNDVSYETLPPYPLLRLGKKVLRIKLIIWVKLNLEEF